MTIIVTLFSKLCQTFNFQYFDLILVPAIATDLQIIMPFDFLILGEQYSRYHVSRRPTFFSHVSLSRDVRSTPLHILTLKNSEWQFKC